MRRVDVMVVRRVDSMVVRRVRMWVARRVAGRVDEMAVLWVAWRACSWVGDWVDWKVDGKVAE